MSEPAIETEVIDKLFLELAQVSKAMTPKRKALRVAMAKAANILDSLVPPCGSLADQARMILKLALRQDVGDA